MGNSNPKTDHLKPYRYPEHDRPLGKVIGVRFPIDVEAVLAVMSSADRSDYVRDAVEEKMKRDGLL
jgi:hypothetical protein